MAYIIRYSNLEVLLSGGAEKDSMLKSIKGYRPQQVSKTIYIYLLYYMPSQFKTIFEVAASRTKSVAAQVMKSKRCTF